MRFLRQHPYWGLFLVALLVRGLYLAECLRHPEFLLPTVDATTYEHFARQWVTTGLRDSTTAWHSAFYPLFLAAVYRALGPSLLIAKLIQALLGAATCAGIAAFAARVLGERARWPAGLLAAFYGPLVFYDLELLPAGWSVTWSLLLFWHLTRERANPTPGSGALPGFLLGVAALLRPELLLGYAGGAMLMVFLQAWRERTLPRPVLAPMLCLGLAFGVVVAPVSLLNHRFTGGWGFLPVNGGLNLYMANSKAPFASPVDRPGPDYDRVVNEPKRQGLFSPAEQNRFFYRRTLQQAAEEPLRTVQRLGAKLLLLLSGREFPSDIDVYTAREPSLVLRGLVWKMGLYGFPFAVLLPLAVLGLRQPRRASLLRAGCFALGLAAVLLLYLPTMRYRLVLFPLLAALAAGGWIRLRDAWKDRNRTEWLRIAGAFAICGALSLAPGFERPSDASYRAERYRMIGQRLDSPGASDGWLARAWALNPLDPQTAFFLALNAWQAGKPDAARMHVDAAIDLSPDFVMARMLRSDLRREQGDLAGAIEDLRRAVDAQPDHVESLHRLAQLLARESQPDAARPYLERILHIEPRNAGARLDLAAVLLDLREAGPAQAILADLLQHEPDNAWLHFHAARAAEMLGQPERAHHHAMEARRLRPDLPGLPEDAPSGESRRP